MRWRAWGLFALAGTIFAAAHLAPHLAAMHGHEDNNLMGAWLVANGWVAYRDFFSHHPPFAYWCAAPAAALFGPSLTTFRAALLVFYGIVLALLFTYNRRAARPFSFALFVLFLALGHVAYLGHLYVADCLFAFAVLVPFYQFWRYDEEHRLRWYDWLVVSAAMVAAMTSTLIAAYPLLVLTVGFVVKFFRYEPRRRVIRRGLGVLALALIPPALVLLYLVETHSIREFYQDVFVASVQFYRTDTGYGSYAPSAGPLAFVYVNTLGGLTLLWDAALLRDGAVECALAWTNVFVVALLVGRRRYAMALAYVAYLLLLMLRKKSGTHYEAPYMVQSFWAAAWLLAPVGQKAARLWRDYRRGLPFEPASVPDLLRGAGAALLLVVLANAYMGEIGETPPPDPLDYEIAETCANLTRPTDRITCFPGMPRVYLASGRMPALQAFSYASWLDMIPSLRDGIVRSLDNQQARVVVIGAWLPPVGTFAWRSFADEIRDAIRRNYQPLALREAFIFARNSSYYEILGRYERTRPRPVVEAPDRDILPVNILDSSDLRQEFTIDDAVTSAKLEILLSASRRSDSPVECVVGMLDEKGRETVLLREKFRTTSIRYYPGATVRTRWHPVRFEERALKPGRYFFRLASPAATPMDAPRVWTTSSARPALVGTTLYAGQPLERTACFRVVGVGSKRPRGVYPVREQSMARATVAAAGIRQTVEVGEDTTLSAIALLVEKNGGAAGASKFALFHKGRIVASETLASPAGDREWKTVTFAPIAARAGDRLTLALDAAGSSPAGFASAGVKIDPESTLTVGGRKRDDELCFKLYDAPPGRSGLPDLAVTAFDFEPGAPASIARGGSLRLFLRVENRGTSPTPASRIELFAEPTDVARLMEELAEPVAVPALQSGESWERKIDRPTYPLEEGSYALVALADRNADLFESNEENNRFRIEGKPLLVAGRSLQTNSEQTN